MKTGAIYFPNIVLDILSQKLADINHNALVASSKRLSENFRFQRNTQKTFFYSPKDIAGYLALRTPATYAQIYGALDQIKEVLPHFKPHSLLDIGSGPGTAMWATQEVFPSLRAVTMIEQQKEFIDLSKTIAAKYPKLLIDWQKADFLTHIPRLEYMYDLVIIANVLNEVGEFEKKKMIQIAKEHCNGVIVILEPGTQLGVEIINMSYVQLGLSGNVIAPFISNQFTLSEKDWIHFSQKIVRPEFQKRIRQALRDDNLTPSDIEEAKYTFVAWSKDLQPEQHAWGRIIAKPEVQKGLVVLTVLTANGVEKVRVLKRHKQRYQYAKNLKWGEVLTEKIQDLVASEN